MSQKFLKSIKNCSCVTRYFFLSQSALAVDLTHFGKRPLLKEQPYQCLRSIFLIDIKMPGLQWSFPYLGRWAWVAQEGQLNKPEKSSRKQLPSKALFSSRLQIPAVNSCPDFLRCLIITLPFPKLLLLMAFITATERKQKQSLNKSLPFY